MALAFKLLFSKRPMIVKCRQQAAARNSKKQQAAAARPRAGIKGGRQERVGSRQQAAGSRAAQGNLPKRPDDEEKRKGRAESAGSSQQ